MTHEELLDKMPLGYWYSQNELNGILRALRAVVELHKPDEQSLCSECSLETNGIFQWAVTWPCLTIQLIEKELK